MEEREGEDSVRVVIISPGCLQNSGLEVNGEARWVVGPGQVVARVGLLLLSPAHPAELLDGQHLALVGDRVHRVLVRVRGLEQAALEDVIFLLFIILMIDILPS